LDPPAPAPGKVLTPNSWRREKKQHSITNGVGLGGGSQGKGLTKYWPVWLNREFQKKGVFLGEVQKGSETGSDAGNQKRDVSSRRAKKKRQNPFRGVLTTNVEETKLPPLFRESTRIPNSGSFVLGQPRKRGGNSKKKTRESGIPATNRKRNNPTKSGKGPDLVKRKKGGAPLHALEGSFS